MSNVTFVSLSLFLQTLVAVLAFTGLLAVGREYFRRRQAHLAFFAIGLLFTSLAYLAACSGQMLAAYGVASLSMLLISGFQHLMAVAMTAVSIGFIRIYAQKKHFGPLATALLAVCGIAIWHIANPHHSGFVTERGYTLPDVTVLDTFLHFLPTLAVSFLFLSSYRLRGKDGQVGMAERVFGTAGIAIGFAFLSRLVVIWSGMHMFVPFSTFFQILALFPLTLAAIAKGHPDPSIARRPTLFIEKRLLYKAAGLNVLLFWLLSFFLVIVTSTFFIQSAVEARKVGLRKDVHFFSEAFASNGARLLEETANIAASPASAGLVGRSGEESLPEAVSQFLRRGASQRILRIVDGDGRVLFSSYDDAEVGQVLDSRVVRKALTGTKVSATELEQAVPTWAVRAAAPLSFPDGTVGGVVLTTDLSVALDFSEYTAIAPINASGYGYVSPTGEIAFSMGGQFDQLTKSLVRKSVGPAKVATVALPDSGDTVFVEQTYASDGEPNGFFYALLKEQQVTHYALRVMSIAILVMYMALVIVGLVLVFAMSMVLRPIKALREATSRVERDDYDVHVRYSNPDEVGELANAFNRMSAAIEDRTVKLRQSLHEQQDFLDHSILDLRTPVNVFRWTLELMRFGDTGRLNRQQLEFLEQLHQTNERLSRMLQNLQDVAQLDRGRYPISIQPFRLEDVIDEVAGEMAVQMREKSVALHWKRPSEPLPAAIGDRAATKKVVAILLANAVKYNQPNGHVEIDAVYAKSKLTVRVEDSGRGIPADEQARVFNRFFRSKASIKEEIEGAGLGLYIAKRLLELQDGTIGFVSQEGAGTTFTFHLRSAE